MQCDEFEARIQLLLDLRKAPETDSQIQWHAQVCSPCRDLLTAQSLLFDGLEMLETPQLPDDFSHRVVQQAVSTAPAASMTHWTWPRLAAVALAAAALVLAMLLPSIWLRPRGDDSNETRRDSVKIASASTDRSDATWWMERSQTILELYSEELGQMQLQQFDEFADGLKPITTSFSAAMAALRFTLPVSHPRPLNSRAGISPLHMRQVG